MEQTTKGRGYWTIPVSFYIAYLLALVPLPDWAMFYRPEWVLMVLIYWLTSLPHRVGIGTAWVAGLGLDLLESAALGFNALIMAVIAYLAIKLHARRRLFSTLQQSLLVLLLTICSLLLSRWLGTLMNGQTAPGGLMFLVPAFTSAIVCPPLFWLLHWLRHVSGAR